MRSRDLSVLAYANGFTLWHYNSRDNSVGAGYFLPARDMLRKGDLLILSGESQGIYRVEDAEGHVMKLL